MRILIDIGHPADVHFFKNIIWDLEKKVHEIKIVAREKDIVLHLLNAYGFKYECLGKHHNDLVGKLFSLIKRDFKLFEIAKKFKPDILISHGSICAAHVSCVIHKPSISHEDTGNMEQIILYAPFTDVILTPTCLKRDFGKKQVRYNGYKELAYLHPNHFKPNPSVLDDLGLSKDDKYVIMRFVSWGATHDVVQKGISSEMKHKFVKELKKYARVFITSEGKLPMNLEKYQINLPPEKIHDLLYYATMYIGDGGTMASEAAVLGTPAVFVSTTVSDYQLDEEQYGLVHIFSNPKTGEDEGLEFAVKLLKDNDFKDKARERRKKLLENKIDVSAFMVWFIENYPESHNLIKINPEIQFKFR